MEDFPVRKAADILSQIIKPQDQTMAREWSSFYASWSRLAGEPYSAHTRPVDLRQGIIVVEADHPGWIQRMQLIQGRLLRQLQASFPSLSIRGIAFKVASDTSIPRPGSRAQAVRNSLEADNKPQEEAPSGEELRREAASLQEVLEAVPDDGFKRILTDLAKTLQKRKSP